MNITTLKSGDVVLAYFPFSNQTQIKLRPVLVAQSDTLRTEFQQLICAFITSNMGRAGGPSRVALYLKDPAAKLMGLLTDSVIVTDHLATLEDVVIYRKIGHMPDITPVQSALRITFNLP